MKTNKHISAILLLLSFLSLPVMGWAQTEEEPFGETIPGQRFRLYTYEGEEFLYGSIDGVDIERQYPTKRELRQGRRRIERYTKLQWYVHSVYPYAQGVAELMAEVERDLHTISSRSDQKEYIKQREEALFARYESDFRRMSRKQGKIFVKLVHRQSGISVYDLIRDTKNGASAFFWNGIGRIFGINLKADFDPEEDAMIDAIVADLDNGGYNIAFKAYNYRLP